MKVVFLDIDGVLNNDKTESKTPIGFTGIGNSLLDRLATIVKITNAKIVLTSTWKDEWSPNPDNQSPDGKYMVKKFKQVGLHIMDKTDESKVGSSHRGAGINKYLEKHPEIEEYVILDDFEFDYYHYENILERFVHTEEHLGLTNENMYEAIDILNGKLKEIDEGVLAYE